MSEKSDKVTHEWWRNHGYEHKNATLDDLKEMWARCRSYDDVLEVIDEAKKGNAPDL